MFLRQTETRAPTLNLPLSADDRRGTPCAFGRDGRSSQIPCLLMSLPSLIEMRMIVGMIERAAGLPCGGDKSAGRTEILPGERARGDRPFRSFIRSADF